MSVAPRLILVDGSAYIFRAYYALPPMTNSSGVPTNAVYGFCNMMLKLIDQYHDDKIEEPFLILPFVLQRVILCIVP